MVFCFACCTVCNNLTLFSFSLSHSVRHFFSHSSPSIITHLLFPAIPTWWRNTPSFWFDSPPPLLCLLFLFSSLLLSRFSLPLSVMAYQDGFYGAADLYVSIPLSSLLPRSWSTFSPGCLWVFQVWNGKEQAHREVYFWVFWSWSMISIYIFLFKVL